METWEILQKLGIAAGLGLLIGLQRQRANNDIAGARTFPLITILGTLAALLAEVYGGWIVGAAILGVIALLVAANVARWMRGEPGFGITTEIAALVMFGVGAYLVRGQIEVAIVIAGGTAVLLHFKEPMHRFIERVGEKDIAATMQFVLIALVILPALPNKPYGPFQTLNPREVWMVVVLIVGIGLAGYIAYKLLGEKAGVILAGIIGGVISSTATVVSYARRTAKSPEAVSPASLAIMLACTVAVVRVIIEVAVVAPRHFPTIAPRIGVLLAVMALTCVAYYFLFARKDPGKMPEQKNPAQLKGALIFGAIYATVKFAVAAAKHYLGDAALYPVAAISGLTNSDAITLSTASLVDHGQIDPHTGARLILTGLIANLGFKIGTVTMLGRGAMALRVAVAFGIAMAAGVAVIFFWPA